VSHALLLEDEIMVSKQSIHPFLKRYSECGTIGRKAISSHLADTIIEQAMRNDD